MSQTREVQVENATEEVVRKGAIAYGLRTEKNTITIGHNKMKLTKNGKLIGDFYHINDLGGKKLDCTKKGGAGEQAIGNEVIGRLVQAGTTKTIQEYLKKNAFDVTVDYFAGKLNAKRQSETVKVNITRDGKLMADMGGFKGTSCGLTIDSFLGLIGKTKTVSLKKKTTPQQVMRTQSV